MRFKEFLNRPVQILDYVKQGYLCHRMELPNNIELCKQVFLAQPKAHRVKYAEKHRIVETDMLKLQEFFEGCHDADVQTSTYAKIVEGKKPPDGGITIGWICSFSLPAITICAFIVLSIFLGLLNLIFSWLAFIKICIPYPKKGD